MRAEASVTWHSRSCDLTVAAACLPSCRVTAAAAVKGHASLLITTWAWDEGPCVKRRKSRGKGGIAEARGACKVRLPRRSMIHALTHTAARSQATDEDADRRRQTSAAAVAAFKVREEEGRAT